MRQIYLDFDPEGPPSQTTPAPLRHRLERVLRLPLGARLTLADGAGRTVACSWEGEVLTRRGAVQTAPEPRLRVTLAAGLIKGERWDWLVEKAAELGADALVPLACDRSVVRVDASKAAEKAQRWQAVAQEAFEQCGRPWLCTVTPPATVAQWLASRLTSTVLLFCDELMPPLQLWDAVATCRDQSQDKLHIALVVGPEGGLSAEERRCLISAGGIGVCLGTAVLRAETAGLAALTITGAAFGARDRGDRQNIANI